MPSSLSVGELIVQLVRRVEDLVETAKTREWSASEEDPGIGGKEC